MPSPRKDNIPYLPDVEEGVQAAFGLTIEPAFEGHPLSFSLHGNRPLESTFEDSRTVHHKSQPSIQGTENERTLSCFNTRGSFPRAAEGEETPFGLSSQLFLIVREWPLTLGFVENS